MSDYKPARQVPAHWLTTDNISVKVLDPTEAVGKFEQFAELRFGVFNHRTPELMTIDNDGNTKLVSPDGDDELAALLALQRDIEERK
jgi:hypothetical protein